ncbi:MAG TPA: selenide, water dikinase SelD, partial [Syntrophobacteraceae bacterium]|nr:selenide, water dikinase SelD [Syntrophobacteraceae bacterium]
MGPTVLSDALRDFPRPSDPDLLIGFETSDDAAVYRLTDSLAVISTVDFITPPVDDPVWFGRIGAANSLSDVYAMGGRPVMALNLVMFPAKELDTEVLRRILLGGREKVVEAGASLAGGHSVDDREPKYGLAVTGIVSPDRILTNRGARPGDALVLTKPVGSGVLFNGCRSGRLPFRELEAVLPQIAALNRTALETALSYDIHACTDITGFGLLGHALEMATASGVAVDLDFGAVPLYPNVLEMYRKGETTGSNSANRELLRGHLELKAALSREEAEALVDPQTSGGLLFSLPPDQAEELVERLK